MSLFGEKLVKNPGVVVGIAGFSEWIHQRWNGAQSAERQGFAAYDALREIEVKLRNKLDAQVSRGEPCDTGDSELLARVQIALGTRPFVSPIAVMGLAGEMGEVMEHLKKHWRDGKHPGEALLLELGDVLHYLTVIANAYGWSLDEVAQRNCRKLNERDALKGAR